MQNDYIYAIGDIHGHANLLQDLQSAIAQHARSVAAQKPKLVYLGDYIDRGPDSARVIDLVRSGLPQFERVFLMGNHEDMMRSFLLETNQQMGRSWLINGAQEAVASYIRAQGAVLSEEQRSILGSLDERFDKATARWTDCSDAIRDLRAILIEYMPPEHMEFLANLALLHETDEFIFVHAGLRPHRSLAQQQPEDLLWIREEFLKSNYNWGKRVIHGHTPSMYGPEDRQNRLNIDTAAFRTGALTAAILNREGVEFLVSVNEGTLDLFQDILHANGVRDPDLTGPLRIGRNERTTPKGWLEALRSAIQAFEARTPGGLAR